MKIRIYIIIILTFIVLPLFPQTGKISGEKDVSNMSQINFTETIYDFGTVKSGVEAIHYFVFSNTGTEPLVISNVRTSCGCAVPEWPKIPVGSGLKDSLKVEYNTKIKGAFDKTISVYTNDSGGMIELRIKGNVVKSK